MASLIDVDEAGLNLCISQSLASVPFSSNFNRNSRIPSPLKKNKCVEIFEIFGEMRKLLAKFQRIC